MRLTHQHCLSLRFVRPVIRNQIRLNMTPPLKGSSVFFCPRFVFTQAYE